MLHFWRKQWFWSKLSRLVKVHLFSLILTSTRLSSLSSGCLSKTDAADKKKYNLESLSHLWELSNNALGVARVNISLCAVFNRFGREKLDVMSGYFCDHPLLTEVCVNIWYLYRYNSPKRKKTLLNGFLVNSDGHGVSISFFFVNFCKLLFHIPWWFK